MIVPHGSVPVNEYSNPSLWHEAYPSLYPYGRGGPEVTRLYMHNIILEVT